MVRTKDKVRKWAEVCAIMHEKLSPHANIGVVYVLDRIKEGTKWYFEGEISKKEYVAGLKYLTTADNLTIIEAVKAIDGVIRSRSAKMVP